MQFARFYTKEEQSFCADAHFCGITHHESPQTYVVPRSWGQTAIGVLQEDVFYPAPLPAALLRVEEPDVPVWLQRSVADKASCNSFATEAGFRIERDIRDVVHRIAGSLTYRGWKESLFSSEGDAKIFYDELRYVLLHQIAAPELGQWQSLGLDWAYGITPPCPYAPQQSIVSYTADTTQVLRRLKILGETAALAQDGLNGRHAATAVLLPIENEASAGFINWKKNSDTRRASEALGRRVIEAAARRVMDACDRDEPAGFDPLNNEKLHRAMEEARKAGLPESALHMAVSYAAQGYEDISFALPPEEETAEDCLETIVSIPDEFIESALTDHSFKSKPAQKLWDALAEAIWSSGAPSIAFRDSIDHEAAPDAPAPAATINLLSCLLPCADGDRLLSPAALHHVTRLMVTALDILPSAAPAYRPLHIGMTNLAALLMSKGLAYDSDEARATAALISAFLSGAARHASAEIAAEKGAFPAYPAHAKEILQNIKDKIALLAGAPAPQKGTMRRAAALRPALCPDASLHDAVREIWEAAYHLGRETGFRHARLTGIDSHWPVQALLGGESQGLMPVFAQLHGKNLTPLVPAALRALGYSAAESNDIYFHAAGHGTLLDAPFINHDTLREKGFYQAPLDAIEAALKTALHIRYAFNRWTLGDDFCEHMLGFSSDDMDGETFDMLTALGFSEEDIDAANAYCCGTLALSGAPHLKPSHMAVFDCDISPAAQIMMQAAVEPFLSGLSRHTVRLDHGATVEDVRKLSLFAWEHGLKNLRIYRENGSLLHALAQPAGMPFRDKEPFEKQDDSLKIGRKSA